jgi:hypothetical protein
MQKAEVHGPVCQRTVGVLARAKVRASDTNNKERDYLVGRALQRWQNQDMGHAWECWYEQHVKLVRLRKLSTWILKRWTHRTMVVAWCTWYEVCACYCATSNINVGKMFKMVTRSEKIQYPKVFGRWHHRNKAYDTKKQNVKGGSKFVTRWGKMKYAKTFGS